MPAKLSIEDCHKIAQEREGQCLTEEYLGSRQKLLWKCKFGHTWEANINSLRSKGCWCPKCFKRSMVLSIEECQKYANNHGGKCLSQEYINCYTKLGWECCNGHTWQTTFSCIRQHNRWCPKCANEKRGIQDPISKAMNLAKSRGGSVLSTTEDWSGCYSKLLWECSQLHRWTATYNNVVNHKRWCPHCAGKMRLSIPHCKMIAKQRNGDCLSTEYINAHQLLEWKCEKSHTWSSNVNNIKNGNWCPYCSQLRSEKLTREIFEELMGCKFVKDRPDFLDRLELDGYNEDLELAFEYNGIYHYEYTHFFHRTQERFEELKERDERKYQICKECGVTLILIPYTFNFKDPEKLRTYIRDQLIVTGFLKVIETEETMAQEEFSV